MPEMRPGGFCARAVAAPDKTSFTIYIYGWFRGPSNIKGIWALTMPYFQWIPVASAGEPEGGHSRTTCHTIGGQLAMVRCDSGRFNRGDTNGGSFFYDMTNLSWSLKSRPSEYQVPKTIYDVIGGKAVPFSVGQQMTGELRRRPWQGLHRSGEPCHCVGSGGGSSPSTGAIVGGVTGGFALLAAIGAGVWTLLHGIMVRRLDNLLMGVDENPHLSNRRETSPWRYKMGNMAVSQPVQGLNDAGV
ncbi:hypothetical protein HOY82DRAFT_598021 [Tuber indicum]|nr:hypothetical protein HOY82DRAFT_598021 [Tuber indicum]